MSEIARLERVAMANFIPWGSHNIGSLVEGLSAANRPLLLRALAFAEHLNKEIVQALRPRLIVVPFSLGRNRTLDAIYSPGLTLRKAADLRRHAVALPRATFNYSTGYCQRGRLTVRVAFLPHPASLRLSKEAKKRVIGALANTLNAD